MGNRRGSRSGFSRADFLVTGGVICFLGLVWLRPSLAGFAARNDEAVCANNLRLIGQAFLQWSHENGEQNPWWFTWQHRNPLVRVYHENAWFHFFMVSNELRSPRFLADPGDDWPNLRVATNWGAQPGGFFHSSSKNNAVSYFLGARATPLQPDSILAGDTSIYSPNRSGGGYPFQSVTATYPRDTYWSDSMHRNKGNLLFNDGRVEMTDTAALRRALEWNTNWNRYILEPRLE